MIREYISSYSSIRFLCVNTATFPQLPFQYNAQISTVQCFINAVQVSVSSTSTVMETIQSFNKSLQTRQSEHYLGLLHDSLESSSLEDNSLITAISSETFGLMHVSEAMKKEIERVVDQLHDTCPDAGAFQQAIHLWNVILKNILKNPQDEKYARIRINNDKIRRLTG